MQYYRGLLKQQARIEAFRRAIHRVVGPGDRVLEVGAGLGTYSFFAADAGAAHVWGVEGNAVIHVADTIARLNGYDERVEFIRGWVPQIKLPERASVLVFEDFSVRLLDTRTYRLYGDLRASYVETNARFIPVRARQYLAPVSETDSHEKLGESSDIAYGIDWAPSREYLMNTPCHRQVWPEAVVGTAAVVSEVEFGAAAETWQLGGRAAWRIERDVVVTGLAYWFDLDLDDDDSISNAPGALPGSWGQLLLPLDPPLTVAEGQELAAEVGPDRFADGAPGWLRWTAEAGGFEVGGHEFASEPAAFADLYARSPDAVPQLSPGGEIEAKVLQLTDGTRTVGEIAWQVRKIEPGLSELAATRLVIEALSGKLKHMTLVDVTKFGG